MKNPVNSKQGSSNACKNLLKSQKNEANLQKNTTLYFQIGLILCLLFSYGLLELKFNSDPYVPEVVYLDPQIEELSYNYQIQKEVIAEPKQKKKIVFYEKPIPNPNLNSLEKAQVDITTPANPASEPTEPDFSGLEKIDEDIIDPISVAFVEQVPVFPGCEMAVNNDERKACMSKKIAKHIQKKFDTSVAEGLGLEGIQRINVMFKIDVNGKVTDVKARTPYSALEKEAINVISKLPNMQPGKQQHKNVPVIYGVPIVVAIQK